MFQVQMYNRETSFPVQGDLVIIVGDFYQFGSLQPLKEGAEPTFVVDAAYRIVLVECFIRETPVVRLRSVDS